MVVAHRPVMGWRRRRHYCAEEVARQASASEVPTSPTADGWQLLRDVLRDQRRGLATGVVIGLLWSLGKVAVPQLTQLGIDRGIEGDGSLVTWALLIAGAGVAAGLFTSLRRWYAFRESRWTETRLRERFYDHVLRLHVGFHDRTQTGQLMSRASSDLQQVQAFVVMIPLTLSNLAMVVAVVAVLFVSEPLLALVALAPLPLVNVMANRFSRRIHPAVLQVQAEQAQLATVVEETVSGVRVVKGFGAEAVQAAKLLEEANDIRSVSMRAARIRSAFLPGIDLLPALGLIAVLGIGGHRVMDGQMSIGELVKFNFYVTLLIAPLRTIGMTVAMAQRAAVALMRVNEVLATVPEVQSPARPVHLPPLGGRVRFSGVRFGYEPDQPVLDHFDLDIAAGESVALVGATGGGKSTVSRLLVRFYDPQDGTVELDGIDIRRMDVHELRRQVSIVFEDTFLFHDDVAANIAFARPDAAQSDVEEAARLAGAHDFITELPDGYATVVGERGFSLSGGQRQRIAIARAILANPRVLVLDDATSAVDPSKEHEIREAMATVMRDRTTIVIAHRAGTIALADSVVLIDGGVVAARGTHEELLATSSRYADVLAAWEAIDETGDAAGDDAPGDAASGFDDDSRERIFVALAEGDEGVG
jgi:ATP-binding cassette, subfamily B, bacterial